MLIRKSFALALSLILYSFSGSVSLAQLSPEADSDSGEIANIDPARSAIKHRTWKLRRGAEEWGVQTAYSPLQPTFFSGNKEYDTTDRRFSLIGLRYGRVFGTVSGVTYEYLFEASPFALALNNEVGEKAKARPKTRRSNTFGVTVQPAGFRFIFRPDQRLKPFVQTAAGFIFTRRPIPVPESTNYNFVGDFGGGVMFSITRRHILKGGYRYYHISNMNIGEINPGYNANMFYVDLTVFSK